MFPMRARQDYAPGAVQQPTDVDLQLVRVRTGQQHAVVQRMQEPLLEIQRRQPTSSSCMWKSGQQDLQR